MDEPQVAEFLDRYLTAFQSLGRGDDEDVGRILAFYGVPLLVTSDSAFLTFADEAAVLDFARTQIDALRETGYDRTDRLDGATTVLNRHGALHRGLFVRRGAAGGEIGRLEATYLITLGDPGLRISALAVRPAR